MADYIPTPRIGDILREEFLEPMNISAYGLAKDIGVPASRIQDILHNRRRITPDTSIRLGIYFNMSETYFLDLQNDLDIREIRLRDKDEFAKIRTAAMRQKSSSESITSATN